MDRLRNLDPRRRSSDQKMQQTSSVGLFLAELNDRSIGMFRFSQTITMQNSPGGTNAPPNGNNDQEPRQKVSSLVFKFGGDRTKKVPTYTFSPGMQKNIEASFRAEDVSLV